MKKIWKQDLNLVMCFKELPSPIIILKIVALYMKPIISHRNQQQIRINYSENNLDSLPLPQLKLCLKIFKIKTYKIKLTKILPMQFLNN